MFSEVVGRLAQCRVRGARLLELLTGFGIVALGTQDDAQVVVRLATAAPLYRAASFSSSRPSRPGRHESPAGFPARREISTPSGCPKLR